MNRTYPERHPPQQIQKKGEESNSESTNLRRTELALSSSRTSLDKGGLRQRDRDPRRAASAIYRVVVHAQGREPSRTRQQGRRARRAREGETGLIRARWPSGFPLMFDSCVWAGLGRGCPAQRERGMRGCIVDSCCCSLVQRAASTSDNRRCSNAVPEPDSLTALRQMHESFCPLTPRAVTNVSTEAMLPCDHLFCDSISGRCVRSDDL